MLPSSSFDVNISLLHAAAPPEGGHAGGALARDGEHTPETGNLRASFKCPLCRETLGESTRDAFRTFEGVVQRLCRPCAKAIDRNRGPGLPLMERNP